MMDPPHVNPHRAQPKRRAWCCAVLVAVLLTLALVFVHVMLLRYKMMPPAGTSPLILLGLQWWPLNPPGGVCPGSASAYRLDEAWVGGSAERSFFDPDTWSFWHGTADPTGGPTQYVDHATALANGMLEEGDGWAVMRAGKPVRPETSDLVPATFQAAESPQITLTLTRTLTLPLTLTLPPTLTPNP